MTTTYIHKLSLGVNVAYNMRHALTGFEQTWKILTLVLENSWNLKKSAFCPVIDPFHIVISLSNRSSIEKSIKPFLKMKGQIAY